MDRPLQRGANSPGSATLVAVLLLGLSLASGFAVWNFRRSATRERISRAAADLQTVAELKARAVALETADHLHDAAAFARNPFLLRSISAFLRNGEGGADVQSWLYGLRDTGRYQVVNLADAEGEIRLTTAPPNVIHLSPHLQSIWSDAIGRAEPTLSRPHRSGPGRPVHSDIIVPLRDGHALLGALIFRLDLGDERGWLSFLPGNLGVGTAELLWPENGGAVVVASSAAVGQGAVERIAVEKLSGAVRGFDRTGAAVVAAFAPVRSVGLVLIVKAAESDILKPVAAQLRSAAVSTALAAGCVLLGGLALWRRRREQQFRALYRRQSEDQELLAASERHFRELVESIPGGVWLCDPEGKLTYISPQIEAALTLPRERALADGWTSVIHPADREACRRAFADAVANHSPFEVVFRAARADGVELTMLGRATPRFSHDGEFHGLVGTVMDITDRQRAEEMILHLSAAVEQSPAVVFMTNTEGSIVYVNRRFTEVTGYAAEEAIGRTPAILKSGETPAEAYRALWDTLLAGGEWRGELRNRRKNGELFWARCVISPIRSPEGALTRFIASQEDITNLKRAETEVRRSADQVRRMVEANLIGTMVTEGDTIVEANGEFLRATGYSLEDLRARRINWRSLTPPEHLPVSEHAHEELRRWGIMHPFEKEYFRKDGSRFPVLLGGTTLRANPRREICFAVDLTDVQQSEREIRRMNGELRRLSAELLRSEDAERRRIARELHDSTAQLLTGIQLNLKRLEAAISAEGAVRPVFDQTAEMARQCATEIRAISYAMHPPLLDDLGLGPAVDMLARGFEERTGIRVATDVDRNIGRLNRDLELAVFRIVQEALTNVQRHSGSASATVRLSARGEDLLLEIEDYGGGAAPAENGAARVGVGLLGMRERAKQFGGEMTLISAPTGATVRVRMRAVS